MAVTLKKVDSLISCTIVMDFEYYARNTGNNDRSNNDNNNTNTQDNIYSAIIYSSKPYREFILGPQCQVAANSCLVKTEIIMFRTYLRFSRYQNEGDDSVLVLICKRLFILSERLLV